MSRKPADLEPARFPFLSWEPGERSKSLEQLHGYVTDEAARALEWYYRKRRAMQRGGRCLRLGAILATGAAGVTPLLAELLERDGQPAVEPLWAAFQLAIAGLLVLLDRFWGFTSAWVRYLRAAQALTTALDAFRIDWESHKLAQADGDPDQEQTQARIDRCKTFLLQVRAVVRRETEAWAREFQNVLEEIEGATQPSLSPERSAPWPPRGSG